MRVVWSFLWFKLGCFRLDLLVTSMSSKRGRKRNDNLPPNRARDIQRAFRARRAAHLLVCISITVYVKLLKFLLCCQALEQRVTELEDENNCLRQALNLPPANRPPLGKGPTGKDKPKPLESHHTVIPMSLSLRSSRDSSSADSPASRASSNSPLLVMPPQEIWDQSDTFQVWDDSDAPPSSTSSSYHLTPMSAPASEKSVHFPYTPPPLSARSALGNSFYVSPSTCSPAERVVTEVYGAQSFVLRSEMRDEQKTHYCYPFSAHNMQSSPQQQHGSPSPYPQRRSLSDLQAFDLGYPRIPNAPTIRLPSPPHLQVAAPRPVYGPEGQIDTIS